MAEGVRIKKVPESRGIKGVLVWQRGVRFKKVPESQGIKGVLVWQREVMAEGGQI